MAITILDGGMGQELLYRGHSGSNGLWSAQALIDAPDVVEEVHRAYVHAGVDVITTNTYSTIPSYLRKADRAADFEALAALAAGIARRAADSATHKVLVAGSLPPLDESYRADLAPPDDVARPIYGALCRALDAHVDLFLCETLSCIREARNAATVACDFAAGLKPVWVSFTLSETPGRGLRSGESVADAVQALAHLPISALLFNCTTPAAIDEGLRQLRPLTPLPLGAYANLLHIPDGWTLDNDVHVGRRHETPEEYLEHAQRWVALGATIIGGCCGIGPKHIAALTASSLAAVRL